MGYLFDRAIRYEEVDGKVIETKAITEHAIYVFTDKARDAAFEIFGDMETADLLRFLYLPFPKICFEWRESEEQVCILLESTDAKNPRTQETFPAVNVAMCIENKAGRMWQGTVYFVQTLNTNGAIPWDESESASRIEPKRRMSSDALQNLMHECMVKLALLNAPNLRDGERVNMAKVNKRRVPAGKLALSDYTILRPTYATSEWVAANKAAERAPAREHWVKGHLHTYWTGSKLLEQQKPVIKLLAPFKRGNPERGSKPQRYVVT